MKFYITDFFSKCDQIRKKLQIWSHLLKKSIMENVIFCPVTEIQLIYTSNYTICYLFIISYNSTNGRKPHQL